jgi:hypothetical protein
VNVPTTERLRRSGVTMAVPGKHDDEETSEVQESTYTQWVDAKKKRDTWAAMEAVLRRELEAQLGSATAGTIHGRKVLTWRPKKSWAIAALVRDYPALTQHYMLNRTVTELDLESFGLVHPEIVAKYQSRQFCLAGDPEVEEEG